MRLAILLNILFSFWATFNEIGVRNRIKQQAELAYSKKDYSTAIKHYKKLIEKYHTNDEKVISNLGHACFKINDTADASYYYLKIINSKSPDISSVANLQLGILLAHNEDYETALKYFRESLKYYSGNEEARYNYELVEKFLQKEDPGKKEKSKNKEKEEQENSNNSNTENANPPPSDEGDEEERIEMEENATATKKLNLSGKGMFSFFNQKKEDVKNERIPKEKGNKESEIVVSNRLKKYHLNEARAKALLESMKEEEIQYIQQRKKYQETDYSKDKPDY